MHLFKTLAVALAFFGHATLPTLSEETLNVIESALVEERIDYADPGEYKPPDASEFTPEAQGDLVTELPGLSILGKRRMFSGYIPVDGQGRGAFMWLFDQSRFGE
jgi:hypothetical protein